MATRRFVTETFDVAAPGGVTLATDVLRRLDDTRRPCLLQRVPYGRRHPSILNGAMDVMHAANDFVVVTQDCRGRGGSNGVFEPFVDEEGDAVATLDWITQQPWSDGTVGLFGRSYAGLNQWIAARSGHEALRAIAPTLSGADPRDWIRPDGVLEWGFVLWWSIRYLAPEIVTRATGGNLPPARLDELIADPAALLGGHVDLSEVHRALPFLTGWLAEGGPQVEVQPPEHCSVPVFATAGWFDVFARGTVDSFATLASDPRSRLVVGPWAHGGGFSGVYPDWDAGPLGSDVAIGLIDDQLDWFRSCLSGSSAESATTVRTFQCGDGRWSARDAWPPVADRECQLWIDVDLGRSPRLVDHRPGLRPKQLLPVPWSEREPVPTRGGQTFLPGMQVAALAGPRSQDGMSDRPDVVAVHGATLDEPLAVLGDARLHITVVIDDQSMVEARRSLLCVRLADRSPDGTAVVIVESAASEPADAGIHRLQIRLGPVGWTFRAGHAPLLLVARSSVPRFRPPHHSDNRRLSIVVDDAVLTLPVSREGAIS